MSDTILQPEARSNGQNGAKRLFAITSRPSPRMNLALRNYVPSHLQDVEVDVSAAHDEHDDLVSVLRDLSVETQCMTDLDPEYREASHELPDIAFPEDPGRDILGVYVVSKMGVESRSPEPSVFMKALINQGIIDPERIRSIADIDPLATFEAGDLLFCRNADDRLLAFVGISSRTNYRAIAALEEIIGSPHVMERPTIVDVRVNDASCLHITTGAGNLRLDAVVADRTLVEAKTMAKWIHVEGVLPCYEGVPNAANAVYVPTARTALMASEFPEHLMHFESRGYKVRGVRNYNHMLVQGGISCRMLRLGPEWYRH